LKDCWTALTLFLEAGWPGSSFSLFFSFLPLFFSFALFLQALFEKYGFSKEPKCWTSVIVAFKIVAKIHAPKKAAVFSPGLRALDCVRRSESHAPARYVFVYRAFRAHCSVACEN
jgi:hypothetical protein